MKKTLLEISLYAQYYKKDITDRYHIKNDNLIITKEAIDILDKPQEKLYIDTWNKIQEKDKEITRLNNIIDELKWKPISQYDNGNYDWVLIKMFIKEDNYECVPIVAEKRMGVWENRDGETLDEDMFEIKYFMDMQQLDKLKELKENKIWQIDKKI